MHIQANINPDLIESYKSIELYEGDMKLGSCLLSGKNPFYALLYSVYIEEELRGFGLGRILVEKTMQIARLMGYKKMWLFVRVQNTPAVNLYKSLGFKFITKENEFGTREMELEL